MGFSGNTTAIDNNTIKQNISGQLYVAKDSVYFSGIKSGIRSLLRTLQDRSVTIGAGTLEVIGESYIDTTGRMNSVTVANTLATFDTNKYKYSKTETVSHDGSFTGASSVTYKSGFKIKTKCAGKLSVITKEASCTATKAYVTDSSLNVIATATFSGNVATFASPVNLTKGTSYYVLVDKEGASYSMRYTSSLSYPISKTFASYEIGRYSSEDTGGYSIVNFIYECTEDIVIEHAIPDGTIPAGINKLVCDSILGEFESGSDVQVKIANDTEDSGYISIINMSEPFEFTAFASKPTKAIIKLIPRGTSPTTGYPSVIGIGVWIK